MTENENNLSDPDLISVNTCNDFTVNNYLQQSTSNQANPRYYVLCGAANKNNGYMHL